MQMQSLPKQKKKQENWELVCFVMLLSTMMRYSKKIKSFVREP